MALVPWRNADGKLIVDTDGKPILCSDCPCGGCPDLDPDDYPSGYFANFVCGDDPAVLTGSAPTWQTEDQTIVCPTNCIINSVILTRDEETCLWQATVIGEVDFGIFMQAVPNETDPTGNYSLVSGGFFGPCAGIADGFAIA